MIEDGVDQGAAWPAMGESVKNGAIALRKQSPQSFLLRTRERLPNPPTIAA